jgi:soluble lytic murein transglycosylase-like protein
MLCGCSFSPSENSRNTRIFIPTVVNSALSWRAPTYADSLAGMQLLHDGPPTHDATLALARTILHTNARIAPTDALRLAGTTVYEAHKNGIAPEFFGATLLQESAFDPNALSSAGAVGIAQFMPSTAASNGIDPYDPFDAIAGSAALIASYVRGYQGIYPDPYAAALAAYNAGPGAVDAYHGVPPYAETREYIGDIYERWARIAGYEESGGPQRIGAR